jgi:TRAP-type C4-dicarboxylate transport system substrate-binding protein
MHDGCNKRSRHAGLIGLEFWENSFRGMTISRHSYSVCILLMSRKLWEVLSPQHQTNIRETAREAKDFERALIRTDNEAILQELRKSEMTITEVSVSNARTCAW